MLSNVGQYSDSSILYNYIDNVCLQLHLNSSSKTEVEGKYIFTAYLL